MPKKVQDNRSRNFCLVVNHYVDLEDKLMHDNIKLQKATEDDIEYSKYIGKPVIEEGKYKMVWDPTVIIPTIKEVKFFICQSEVCPKTGRPHLQCYFELTDKYSSLRAQQILKLPHDVPQFRKKNREAAINYCKKEKTRDPYGIFYCTDDKYNQGKGRRTDIAIILKEIQGGMKLNEIMVKYPSEYNRYNKWIKDISLLYSTVRTEYPEVIIRYGTSGTGKTQSWYNEQLKNPDDVYVLHFPDTPGKLWFDGYYQQRICVFEEFKPNKMDITTLLTFLDNCKKLVEVKNGFTQFNSPTIIITTNINPLEWYKNANDDHRLAVLRKILSCKGKVYHHRYNQEPYDRTPQIQSICDKYRTSENQVKEAIKRDDDIYDNYSLFHSVHDDYLNDKIDYLD